MRFPDLDFGENNWSLYSTYGRFNSWYLDLNLKYAGCGNPKMSLFGSNEAHSNALYFRMEFFYSFYFVSERKSGWRLSQSSKNTTWSNERNYNSTFGGFCKYGTGIVSPIFSLLPTFFFKTNFQYCWQESPTRTWSATTPSFSASWWRSSSPTFTTRCREQ